MWPQWLRSPNRAHCKSISKSKSGPYDFRCSSFKDIDSLLNDDGDGDECESSPFSRRHRKIIFHRIRISNSVLRSWAHHRATVSPPLAGAEQSVVLYFTSLRVVRRTYEDCRAVRSILRGFRVPIDERDVSMDSEFLEEVQGMVGVKSLKLPRVFVGGAEEVRELHDCGALNKMIGRLPVTDTCRCEVCGDHRFVVCEQCSGSHKVYLEKSGFTTCSACNVNGLIRCSYCFSASI